MKVNIILNGDALTHLKELPGESVNCIMTSPPYWALRDYGKQVESVWGGSMDCEHDFNIQERKLHSGSTSEEWVNDMSRGIRETAGEWKTKDGFCSKCGAWKGQLGLEPTFELYIKHLCDIFDEVKRVLRKDGTCWVNLGDTYSGGGRNKSNSKPHPKGYKDLDYLGEQVLAKSDLSDKSLCLIPFRFAIEMVNHGWILRNTIIWHKPNVMPSSVKDRFTVDFEYLFFFVKNKKYWFETQYDPIISVNDSRVDKGREEHIGKSAQGKYGMNATVINSYGRNKRAVWKITTKPFKEAHFAVYPEELCETPIKSGCPEFVCNKCGKPREKILEPTEEYSKFLGKGWHDHLADSEMGMGQQTRGFSNRKGNVEGIERYKINGLTDCGCNAGFSGGIILDPFFGSGTTGLVALKQNKQFIGIELNPEYVKIAEARLKPYLEQEKLI